MALYTELSVYRDTYQLILKVFEYTKDFPKEYKYTLGQDMKRDALHLLRSIYRVNKYKTRRVSTRPCPASIYISYELWRQP